MEKAPRRLGSSPTSPRPHRAPSTSTSSRRLRSSSSKTLKNTENLKEKKRVLAVTVSGCARVRRVRTPSCSPEAATEQSSQRIAPFAL